MPTRKRSGTARDNQERAFAALIDTSTGGVALVEPGSGLFERLGMSLMVPRALDTAHATAIKDVFPEPGKRSLKTVPAPWAFGRRQRTTMYQWLTGTVLPSLRQRLLPPLDDLGAIVDAVEFYRKHHPWVNRALILRAGINAGGFRIVAPGNKAQHDWMTDLSRELDWFGLMREIFWNLRAFGQVVTIWRTAPGGRDPVAIECANLQVYQPRYNPLDGANPRIVVLPGADENLKQLVQATQAGDAVARARAEQALRGYPAPLVDALRSGGTSRIEVAGADLEKFGFHFAYAAYDRRHWEDWGHPGMYSIFPYLEMLMLGDDADINALHHLKAGILLVRLGPREPRAGDEGLLATEPELKAVETRLQEMLKARLPHWAARGDLSIEWVVPPDTIMNPQKVASAKEKVLDWLGFPRIAWAGQDFQGAFAAAQVALKFLYQESLDERALASGFAERWFFGRAKAANKFPGAVWPKSRFDPNALQEPRWILEMARLMLQFGGADEQTIAETLGYDAEVWLARRQETKQWKKRYGTDFAPEFVPQRGPQAVRPQGRPITVDQETPERGGLRQPRPSTSEAAEIVERHFGIRAEDVKAALDVEFVAAE